VQQKPVVAHPDEPCRAIVYRMAATGLTRFPVVDRSDQPKLTSSPPASETSRWSSVASE
jgi:hypothetical protein